MRVKNKQRSELKRTRRYGNEKVGSKVGQHWKDHESDKTDGHVKNAH